MAPIHQWKGLQASDRTKLFDISLAHGIPGSNAPIMPHALRTYCVVDWSFSIATAWNLVPGIPSETGIKVRGRHQNVYHGMNDDLLCVLTSYIIRVCSRLSHSRDTDFNTLPDITLDISRLLAGRLSFCLNSVSCNLCVMWPNKKKSEGPRSGEKAGLISDCFSP
jgi:hypothetical protein